MGILDLIFPKTCLSCGRRGRYLCASCLAKQKAHFPQVCPECERPAVDGRSHFGCRRRFDLDGLGCVFVYEGPARKAIITLKYRFSTDLADELVEAVYAHLKRIDLDKKSLLVPIPLARRRYNWRGFNQSEVLGRLISHKVGWGFQKDLLIRTRSAKIQTSLKSAEERKANIKGVFSLNPLLRSSINSRQSLILFDDVWTTGSTLKEAAGVLKRGGFKKVWGLTIAR